MVHLWFRGSQVLDRSFSGPGPSLVLLSFVGPFSPPTEVLHQWTSAPPQVLQWTPLSSGPSQAQDHFRTSGPHKSSAWPSKDHQRTRTSGTRSEGPQQHRTRPIYRPNTPCLLILRGCRIFRSKGLALAIMEIALKFL